MGCADAWNFILSPNRFVWKKLLRIQAMYVPISSSLPFLFHVLWRCLQSHVKLERFFLKKPVSHRSNVCPDRMLITILSPRSAFLFKRSFCGLMSRSTWAPPSQYQSQLDQKMCQNRAAAYEAFFELWQPWVNFSITESIHIFHKMSLRNQRSF